MGLDHNFRHATFGLVTEVGELVDSFKRHYFYGLELDTRNVKEEIGDILWYVALAYHALDESIPNYVEDISLENSRFHLSSTDALLAGLVRKSSDVFFFFNALKDKTCVTDDLEDILVYLKLFCEDKGIDIYECADANVEKLKKRYPEKFTVEDAVNRDVENELSHI